MKILIFTENYRCGGLDTFLITLINNWPEKKDEIVLICNKTHPGLKTITSSVHRQLRVVEHDIFTFKVASKWKILTVSPDFLRKAILLFFFFTSFPFQVLKIKRLLSAEGSGRLLVVNGGYPAGDTCLAATIAWGLIKNKPGAWHNFHNYAEKPHPLLWIWGYIIDSLVRRYSAGFISVSRGCARSLSNRMALHKVPVEVILNGIDRPEPCRVLNIRDELSIDVNDPICLMLATYEIRKGHKFLFDAFRIVSEKIPNANLVICGDRTEREYLEVNKLRNEIVPTAKVHLLPFRNDIFDLIHQADVLAVPSQSFESFGLSSVEAMALKVPVVATNVGGIPEVVENGEGGYCVDSHDAEQFANRLVDLLLDKKLAAEQGEKGYIRYQENFCSARMAQQYSQLVRGPESSDG